MFDGLLMGIEVVESRAVLLGRVFVREDKLPVEAVSVELVLTRTLDSVETEGTDAEEGIATVVKTPSDPVPEAVAYGCIVKDI